MFNAVTADSQDAIWIFMACLQNWLRYKSYQFWGTGTGMLILLFLVCVIALIFYSRLAEEVENRRGTPEIATITGFRVGAGKYHPGLAFVSAQDAQGVVGGESVQLYLIAGCEVGDKIRAERSGTALKLLPAPCPIEPGWRETEVVRSR